MSAHRHWVNEYNPTRPALRSRPCRHFMRGNCQRGVLCNFLHTYPVRAEVVLGREGIKVSPHVGADGAVVPMVHHHDPRGDDRDDDEQEDDGDRHAAPDGGRGLARCHD